MSPVLSGDDSAAIDAALGEAGFDVSAPVWNTPNLQVFINNLEAEKAKLTAGTQFDLTNWWKNWCLVTFVNHDNSGGL